MIGLSIPTLRYLAQMSEEALSGTLADLPLDAVLSSLAANGRTGVLRVGEGNEIWLDEGQIYLVLTPTGADAVAVLFGAGEGTLEEIASLLAKQSDVSATLAERSPEAARSLERLLHEHNLHLLFELLVPSDRPFVFEDSTVHALGHRFRESTEHLVTQAKRRLEIWSQIASRIPSTAAAFRLASMLPQNADERTVTADEWRYLSLLDGHRSVADVITTTKESAFRVCSSLYRMLLEGMIEEVPTA